MKYIIFILIALALTVGLTSCGLPNSPGDGEKVGQIVRLSKHGIFNKTWEAQIIRGGFNGGSGVNGLAFEFTVEDESLVPLIRDYMDNQTEIKIQYRTEGIYFCLRSDSNGNFLKSISKVDGSNPSKEERKAVLKAKIQELKKELTETENVLNSL